VLLEQTRSHGVNVQVIPVPRRTTRLGLTTAARRPPRRRCRRRARIGQALAHADITTYADTAYHGPGPTVQVTYRGVRSNKTTRKFARRNLSKGQKARQPGPFRAPHTRRTSQR
jgi:hypothetical protein